MTYLCISLSATYLRNRIIGALRSSNDPLAQAASSHVSQDLIFSHPTIQRLAAAVEQLVHSDSDNVPSNSKEDAAYIERMVAKYSLGLPTFKGRPSPDCDLIVLLTGSTGNLGSHILASLLSEKRVVKVFTLNRSSPRHNRQEDSFADSGFPLKLLGSKALHPLVGDISLPDLGLEPGVFAEVKSQVTHIIHNAWRLDFNLSLSSFEGLVASARNLIDISGQCHNPVHFSFTSSISSAQRWDVSHGPVPEEVLPNAEVAVGWGYGASKYVVERVSVLVIDKRETMRVETFM